MFEFELALGRVHLLYDLRIYSTPLYMSPPNKQAYIIECLDQNIEVYWWRRWKHHLPVFSRFGRWNYQSRNCEVIDETISSSFPVFLFLRILKRFQKGRPPAVFVFVQSRALAWRQRGEEFEQFVCVSLYFCICMCIFVFVYLYLCIVYICHCSKSKALAWRQRGKNSSNFSVLCRRNGEITIATWIPIQDCKRQK